MPAKLPHQHHDEIAQDGFTVIRNFLTPQEIDHYYSASKLVIEYLRKGNWKHVRTRGKQFPPWPSEDYNPDIWGVTGLLNPGLGLLSKPYHDFYADDKMLQVVKDILQCESNDDLSMELLNMLINPLTDFELDWHRDTIKPEVSPEEEAKELLENPYAGAQFNLALTPDECLIVVPRSHNRVRTEHERGITVPVEKRRDFIEGQITVSLQPGDIVFYNNNILHRAKYDSSKERITLHGSYGHVKYGEARAKGIIQHGVSEWLDDLQSENQTLCQLRDKLKLVAEKSKSREVVYALDG